MKIRLDKYLADMSAATRGDVKRQIVKGMVAAVEQLRCDGLDALHRPGDGDT